MGRPKSSRFRISQLDSAVSSMSRTSAGRLTDAARLSSQQGGDSFEVALIRTGIVISQGCGFGIADIDGLRCNSDENVLIMGRGRSVRADEKGKPDQANDHPTFIDRKPQA